MSGSLFFPNHQPTVQMQMREVHFKPGKLLISITCWMSLMSLGSASMPEYETTKPVSVIRGHDVLLTQIAHRSRYFPKLAGTHGSHGWDFMSPLAPRRVE